MWKREYVGELRIRLADEILGGSPELLVLGRRAPEAPGFEPAGSQSVWLSTPERTWARLLEPLDLARGDWTLVALHARPEGSLDLDLFAATDFDKLGRWGALAALGAYRDCDPLRLWVAGEPERE
jgi:hypothetical protein